MKAEGRLLAVVLAAASVSEVAADGQTRSRGPLTGSRFEAGTYFGAMIAGKEIELERVGDAVQNGDKVVLQPNIDAGR